MCVIMISGCAVKNAQEKSNERSSDVAVEQKNEKLKRYIYLVVPEDMRVDGVMYDEIGVIGCNDQLVRIEDGTLTSPVQALEKMMQYNDVANGYYNGLAQSQMTVVHVMTDTDGSTNVFLTGTMNIGGVCDAPRIQAQLEHAVQQFDENSSVHIFVNDVRLEEILSGK